MRKRELGLLVAFARKRVETIVVHEPGYYFRVWIYKHLFFLRAHPRLAIVLIGLVVGKRFASRGGDWTVQDRIFRRRRRTQGDISIGMQWKFFLSFRFTLWFIIFQCFEESLKNQKSHLKFSLESGVETVSLIFLLLAFFVFNRRCKHLIMNRVGKLKKRVWKIMKYLKKRR